VSVIVVAPGFLMSTLFGPEYSAGALALLILIPGYVFSSSAGSCANTLVMTGHQKASMMNSVGSVALYMALAPFMSIWWGIAGAASALALSQMVKNAHGLWLVKKKVGVWSVVSLSPTFLREVFGIVRRNLTRSLAQKGGGARRPRRGEIGGEVQS